MKLEDYKKAEKLVDLIDSIKDITKEFNVGRVSNDESFTENNNDFCGAKFFHIINTEGHHSTGGGSTSLSRITICKHKDRSGSKYVLSKQETIKLQEFLKGMLNGRLQSLEIGLNNI